jgi:CHAT domain-containing protein
MAHGLRGSASASGSAIPAAPARAATVTRTNAPVNGYLSGVTALVPPGELHATVFLGPTHISFVMNGAGEQRLTRLQVDVTELRRDLGHLLARIGTREDTMPLLRSLYTRLAAPLDSAAQAMAAQRLVLRLDGELRYLPFAALHDGNGHLLDRYVIEQRSWVNAATPSLTRSARRQTRPDASTESGPPWVQAFGSSRAAAGLPALPGVKAELCAIVDGSVVDGSGGVPCLPGTARGAMAGEGWLNDAFSAEQLRQAAASSRPGRQNLLHIASHFVLRPGEIGRSWLLLGQGRKLQLDELLSWSWHDQDLVSLSACQTGLGGGAEVDGLAAMLLQQGAGAVVATLWPVDDRTTAELMGMFYRRLHEGADPAVALRDAQLSIRGAYQASGASGRPGDASGPAHLGQRSPMRQWAGFYITRRGP